MNDLKWIVVPGGPGLSNIYLKYPLERMTLDYDLIFYDMYGSPESQYKNLNIDAMVNQINQVAKEEGLSKYGLIRLCCITNAPLVYDKIQATRRDFGIPSDVILFNTPQPIIASSR